MNILVGLVLALTLTTACGDQGRGKAVTQLPLIKEAPEYSGTSQHGNVITRADVRGNVYLAYFFFTSCSGPCPVMNSKANVLQAAYAGAKDFRIVGFSVDPGNDTVERLARYADRYSAKHGRWYMLRNSEQEVAELASKGFMLGDASVPALHSTRFALVDRDGMIRGYYDGMDDKAMDELRAAINFLLGRDA